MFIAYFVMFLWLHLLLYFILLRHLRVFTNEKAIFFFHVVSYAACALTFLVRCVASPSHDANVEAIFVLAAHGIYSLSFLELWSLAQGGYSLRILAELETARKSGALPDLNQFTRIGDAKKTNRLDGLDKLRLIKSQDQVVSLTIFGSFVAGVLSGIAWLANVKNEG